MDRVIRLSPRRGRLLWAAAAAGAVAAVALLLKVVGVADDVEFVATLLVAPVVVAALLGDRNLGYVAAGVAAVGYLSLRFDDMEQVGALGVVALVVFRAGSYGFVAYLTPLVYARLTGDEARPVVAPRHLRVDILDPDAAQFAAPVDEADDYWEPEAAAAPDHEWDATSLGPPAPAWEAAPDESPYDAPAWQEPEPASPVPSFAQAWQDEPEEVEQPALQDPWAPVREELPPAPRVPTGWIDDATSPLGDETIPVGYTGELFLGKELGLMDPFARPAAAPAAPHLAPTNGGSNGGAHIARGVAPTNGHDRHDDDRYAGAHVMRHPAEQQQQPQRSQPQPMETVTQRDPSAGVDAETRLWNAQYFRDRLTSEIDTSRRNNEAFSVVMIQVADEPFQALPYRRQVALLRELGHQFVPRFFDHLVHLPDGAQHWFAVVLGGTDRTEAQAHERRLRTTIAGYLRSRGLRVGEVQSASLTSPDDDEAMATVWSSLLGADPHGVGA